MARIASLLRAAALAFALAAGAFTSALAQTEHYKVVHVFGLGMPPDATHPMDAPTVGPDRALYGTATAGAGFGNDAGAIWRLGHDGAKSLGVSGAGVRAASPASVSVGALARTTVTVHSDSATTVDDTLPR